jgi:hypothetical protein
VIKSHLLCQLSYAPALKLPGGNDGGECRQPNYNTRSGFLNYRFRGLQRQMRYQAYV